MSEIKIPTSAEEARTMAALGFKWLEDNAPEQLTQHWRDMQAEAGRAGFIAGYKGFALYDRPHAVIEKANKYADSVRRGEA